MQMCAAVAAKPLWLCQPGAATAPNSQKHEKIHNTEPPAGLSPICIRTVRDISSTAIQAFWNVIFCYLDMLQCAVVSEAWSVERRPPRRHSTLYMSGKQISHRWSVWKEKKMANKTKKYYVKTHNPSLRPHACKQHTLIIIMWSGKQNDAHFKCGKELCSIFLETWIVYLLT